MTLIARVIPRMCFPHRCNVRLFSNRNIINLRERGMFKEIFPNTSAQEITDLLNVAPQCVYAGFDPTAPSLHIGNLLVLVNLIHWQRGGHQAIALVGGATGQIGDPSGRSKEREVLPGKVVRDNATSISQTIQRIFDNHERLLWKESDQLSPVKVVNNVRWYKEMNAIDLVCGIGRHMRMGDMLSRHSVASRLRASGLTFTEFAYQMFQAFDWWNLFKHHNCRFQVGGNDQLGNIMSGHELISRLTDSPVYGLTMPLITTEAGNKFGKTAGNAVWLDAEVASPFELYQFFIRTADADVQRLLLLFTFHTVGEIKDVIIKHEANPELRLAQKRLAEQVTLLVHGEEGLESALRTSSVLYDTDLATLSALSLHDLGLVFSGAPIVKLLPEPGLNVLQLALKTNCFRNEDDARRIISAGGFYVNHKRVTNLEEVLTPAVHILANNISLIRVGKKNYWIVQWLP